MGAFERNPIEAVEALRSVDAVWVMGNHAALFRSKGGKLPGLVDLRVTPLSSLLLSLRWMTGQHFVLLTESGDLRRVGRYYRHDRALEMDQTQTSPYRALE